MSLTGDIIDGITAGLNAGFGESTVVHSEEIDPGSKQSCFFISTLKPLQKQMTGPRYQRRNPFDVQYYPSASADKNSELETVAEKLYEVLEYINVKGDLVRGTSLQHEKKDGVLHFYVEYSMFLIRQAAEEQMETMTARTETKG